MLLLVILLKSIIAYLPIGYKNNPISKSKLKVNNLQSRKIDVLKYSKVSSKSVNKSQMKTDNCQKAKN